MVSPSHESHTRRITVEVSDLSCTDLPLLGLWQKRPRRFRLNLSYGQSTGRTALSARSTRAEWGETITLSSETLSSLTIAVAAERTGRDEVVGIVKVELESLDRKTTHDIERTLVSRDGSPITEGPASTFHCRIFINEVVYAPGDTSHAMASEPSDDADRQEDTGSADNTMKDLVDATRSQSKQLGVASPFLGHIAAIGETVNSVTNEVGLAGPIWGSVVDKVRVFMDVADTIAEIHPYAKTAWSIISVVPKLVNSQLQNDRSMHQLGKAMDDMFDFYIETKELHDIRSHKATIERIVLQTMESALLIRKYVETPSFWSRTVKYAVSDIRTKFEEHTATFESLTAIFVQYSTIHTEESARLIEAATARIEVATFRTLELVESSKEMLEEGVSQRYLDDMQFNFDAQCVPEKRCLTGTRVRILDAIVSWAGGYPEIEMQSRERHPSILLLTGVAGSGKSAIAHEVARRFADVRRLGSSFCFDVSRQAARSPITLFGTIARGIAEVDKGWRMALLAVLKTLSSSERQTTSMTLQLQNFLQRPSEQLHCIGPIVIIIDALDESGDAEAREPLLQNILEMAAILPPAFRFLITTRPEKDIMDTLGNAMSVQQMDVTSVDPDSIISDIHSFIRKELSGLGDHLTSASEDLDWAMQLAERSEGSFQWAATACKFIKGRGKAGQTPDERMGILLAQEGRRHEPLDDIYVRVLNSICDFGADDSPARWRYQVALGLVLAIWEPLSLRALKELLKDDAGAIQAIMAFLPYLGSLFEGVGDDNRSFRPFHTSVRDFLTTEERSKEYCVQPTPEHETLAQASLQTIARGPQFNICQIESSYVANADIPDLQQKIEAHISPALSYAHRFWDAHVRECKNAQVILLAVVSFFDESVLVWLEVMSFLGMVNTIGMRVSLLREWNKQQKGAMPDSTFTDLTRCVSMCGSAISVSAPHIYLSALAFIPRTSFIYDRYVKRYSRTLQVTNNQDIQWPRCLLRLNAGGEVGSIAVSPDGYVIASAQNDLIWFWDAATGERVGEPLAGHQGEVISIAFSAEGKTLVSGLADCTIMLWNTATGQPIGQPLCGHTSEVLSVSFSQDTKMIVSGASDNTVRIWNAVTQQPVCILEGHSDAVRSVAFSPDGTRVISGSADETVRLWDVATREQIGVALTGHEGEISSIQFSPDGKTFVSGSVDHTIRLWDVAKHASIGEPLTGHSNFVDSVTFSADGSQLISSSSDSSIRVWDVAQRRQVGCVMTGHRGSVKSAVFPSDGQKVVSGSFDRTIRVWDVTMGELMSESVVTLLTTVWSVAFSPDGRRLASGLDDGTIRLWDPITGQAIGKPLISDSEGVYSVVFSSDGQKLASGSFDRTIRQWDVASGDIIGSPLAGHTSGVSSVDLSSDGRWIVSGSWDERILWWDATSGEQDGEFVKPGTAEVNSVALSPDGRMVLAGLDDGTLRLWDTATRELIGDPLVGHTEQVWSVRFSSDGRMMASGSQDRTIRLWDVETRQPVGGPLTGHTSDIRTVVFSPDGTRIVSGSDDRTVRQWSVANQEPIGHPLAHTGDVLSLAMAPDGQQIVVGTEDGSIRPWKTSEAFEDTLCESYSASPNTQALPYTDSSPMEDGWVLGPNRELLFWIAPDYRSALRKPGNEWVISARTLELDLSRFAHGTLWTDCQDLTAEM